MLVSIAIINEDESLYLRKFFGSIDEKWKEHLDFIFVDNCSSDNSIEVAGRYGIEKIIPFKKKSDSIAVLYNAALEKAEGEYVLFVHSDVIFGKGFFERLWRHLVADPPDVMNFQVYYVNKSTKADSAIFWNTDRQEIYNMQLWGKIPAGGFSRLVSCSDCCFIVKAELARLEKFNEIYRNNFFIHEFILRQKSNTSRDICESSASVEHFFIEKHKQLRTISHDEINFIKNNLSVLFLPESGHMFNNRESYISSLEASLGESRLAMNQASNAIQKIQGVVPALEKLLKRTYNEATSAEILIEAGEICFNFGNYKDARGFFEKAIQLEPENAEALNNLGVINIQSGNYELASDYIEKALKFNPQNKEAKQNLDILSALGGSGNSDKANVESCPELDAVRIGSHYDYDKYMSEMRSEYKRREHIEKKLTSSARVFIVKGYCYICKRNVDFYVDYLASKEIDGVITPNWRERLVCPVCGLVNRMRASIQLFKQILKPQRDARIYITEQVTPMYRWLAENYVNVTGSEYHGDLLPMGQDDSRGIRNESLTALTFPDEHFDFVLSFDVFEHIPDFKKAFAECFRVLKPGGSLFFSVPFISSAKKNSIRALLKDDRTIEHLLPPQYHGDPMNAEGCLAFQTFGWELLEQLKETGFKDAGAYLYWSEEYGYLGKEQRIFIASKEPANVHASAMTAQKHDDGAVKSKAPIQLEKKHGAGPHLYEKRHQSAFGTVLQMESRAGTALKEHQEVNGRYLKRPAPSILKRASGIICLRPFYVMEFFYHNVFSCTCPDWIKYNIGDIRNKSIAEIWNSNNAILIRKKMYEGKWEDICNPICPTIINYRKDNKFIKYDDLYTFDYLTPGLINEIRANNDYLESPPAVFKLDNSKICNLSCIMCSRGAYADDVDLLKKTARDIITYLPYARKVILTGLGDPFARPDTREMLINYSGHNPDLKFDIITNALLLPKYWDRIKHQKFGKLLISIDAATRDTYEKIRAGGSWDVLLCSLSLVRDQSDKFSSVTLNMTVMKSNYREIPEFINFAESYGFDVSFQKIRGNYCDENIFEFRNKAALDELEKILTIEQSKRRNINVYWADLNGFAKEKEELK